VPVGVRKVKLFISASTNEKRINFEKSKALSGLSHLLTLEDVIHYSSGRLHDGM